MSAADEIPEWARPLLDGPIELDEFTDQDEFSRTLARRLNALFRTYNCQPTPAGWRELALRLALDHEIAGTPAMKVLTPVDRQPKFGGAEPGKHFWLKSPLRKLTRQLGSAKSAATLLSKSTGISARRLQNLAADAKAGRVTKPRFLQRLPWEARINAGLAAAADMLEAQSRK